MRRVTLFLILQFRALPTVSPSRSTDRAPEPACRTQPRGLTAIEDGFGDLRDEEAEAEDAGEVGRGGPHLGSQLTHAPAISAKCQGLEALRLRVQSHLHRCASQPRRDDQIHRQFQLSLRKTGGQTSSGFVASANRTNAGASNFLVTAERRYCSGAQPGQGLLLGGKCLRGDA